MSHLRLTFLITLLLSTSLVALAADLGQVKAAMQQRQPLIETLWAEGKIGENNQGLIEARGGLSEQQQELVRAENADRITVYQAIARSTQSTPKLVGVQRALQISQRAANGLWIQDAAGKWYQK
jgi:uncharacterized protein YdbL (DUF1318 family)